MSSTFVYNIFKYIVLNVSVHLVRSSGEITVLPRSLLINVKGTFLWACHRTTESFVKMVPLGL